MLFGYARISKADHQDTAAQVDALKAAGDPATITDPATVRRDFDESRWVRWNLVRVVSSIAATGCLAWALVLTGRATG